MKKLIPFKYGICYSGYRHHQSPITKVYPSYEEIKEDLLILQKHFQYLRMYDTSLFAQTTLKVIKDLSLPFKVILGQELLPEINNPNASIKVDFTLEELNNHQVENQRRIKKLADIGNQYQEIILALAIGNESHSSWNINFVTEESLINYAKILKRETKHLITFCDGTSSWYHLSKLVEILDFISIHSYPQWAEIPLSKAIEMNIKDYKDISEQFKNKQIIFTEIGWTTNSDNKRIAKNEANEQMQKEYYHQLRKVQDELQIVMFYFEAFDEPWKGSDNLEEPEKHWGLYKVNRSPKKAIFE